jgi:hypothetical protein
MKMRMLRMSLALLAVVCAAWAGEPASAPAPTPAAKAADPAHPFAVGEEEKAKLPCDPAYPISDWTKRRDPKHTVWVMNADGTGAEPVAMGTDPHWSPDGKYLAYRTEPTPNKRMMCLLDVEKKQEWLFRAVGGYTPTFTMDSKYCLCGGPRIGVYRIEDIVGGNAAPPMVPKLGSPGCNAEISRDGKVLAHVLDD